MTDSKYIPIEEKALFYLHHISSMFYGFRCLLAFSLLGIIGLVMIIIERHFSFKYFLSIVIGLAASFIDVNIRVSVATKKPLIYEKAFEWEKTAYHLRLHDESLTRDRVKFFSLNGIRLGIKNFLIMSVYESYKWIFLFVIFMFSIVLAIYGGSNGGAAFLTISLSMVSWGWGYLILWRKKYFKQCAKTFGITDERYIAIRDFYK